MMNFTSMGDAGGNLSVSRMGRSYEIFFPPKALNAATQISMLVTEFDGSNPLEFQLEGRIVSNRVEIQPIGLELAEDAVLKIPHFCADQDLDLMFIAGLHSTAIDVESAQRPPAPVPQSDNTSDVVPPPPPPAVAPSYEQLPGGHFNVPGGAASISVRRLGVFYACSRLPDGVDRCFARCSIPSLPAPGAELLVVARDWFPGQARAPPDSRAEKIAPGKHSR
jgi:hypothetical protein